jgi:hypothetical protein
VSEAEGSSWRWKAFSQAGPGRVEWAPGAVPPFGNLFGLPVLVGELLLQREDIAFNAGSRRVYRHAGAGLRPAIGRSGVPLREGAVAGRVTAS